MERGLNAIVHVLFEDCAHEYRIQVQTASDCQVSYNSFEKKSLALK